MKKVSVILRKLSQVQSQTGRSTSGVIEWKLIPNKTQYTKGLAEGLVAQQGNGIYYLAIGANTNTSSWTEGEIVEVLFENGEFVSELGAQIANVAERQGNVLAGTVSFEMSKQTVLWNTLLKSGAITPEMYAQKMNSIVDIAVAKAEAKVEAKAEARRVSAPPTDRRNLRGIDLSMFAVTTTPVVNEAR